MKSLLVNSLPLLAAHAATAASAMLLSAAFALPAFAAGAPAPAKADLAKGQEKAATCVACHTADGTRGLPANPILQGQHAEYIVKQLTEFKAGKRANAIMAGMAAALTPEDMVNVAAARRSTAAASLPSRCPPAPAATPPAAPACLRSTRAWAASMPITPKRSWSGSVRVPAATRPR